MNFRTLCYTLLLGLTILTICGCDDDDGNGDGNRIPLTYDPATTIYGTFGFDLENSWEVVIDPVSGQLDSIPGTSGFSALSFPLGPRYFQTFNPDRRVQVGLNQQLSVQDLETFQAGTFMTSDPDDQSPLTNPQFITQGRSENELLVLDADQSLWRANLQSLLLERWIDDISPQGRIVVYLYQLDDTSLLRLFSTNTGNDGVVRMMDVLETEEQEILDFGDLSEQSFGFVKHPAANDFYFLTSPGQGNGFRLGILSWDGENLTERIISTQDLGIDNLAPQRQTIHTATNSFIAISTNGDIEDPQQTLLRIDLTTGELVGQTELERSGFLFKLAGE